MGILNNKSRVLDTIITRAGKSNLALGGLDIKYVSFTDGTAYYFPYPSGNLDRAVLDDSIKFQLESSNLPQDQVVFGVNEQGNIQSSTYSSLADIAVSDGNVIIYDNDVNVSDRRIWTNRLVSSSMDNFRDLKLISTFDSIFEDDDFGTIPDNTAFTGSQFTVRRNLPLTGSSHSRQESSLPDIFRDPLFGNRLNYKFLPPIRKLGSEPVDKSSFGSYKDYVLAQYSPWGLLGGEENILTIEEILTEHEKFIDSNNYQEIKFDPTSRDNNLLIQGFEITQTAPNDLTPKSLNKLFFVDYGLHRLEPQSRVRDRLKLGDQVHVVFAGRLHKKSNNDNYAFMRLFTMIFG